MKNNLNWFLPDYKQYADKVIEWNLVADGGTIKQSIEKRNLQKQLIQEEFDEVIEAFTTQNKVEFLKELCDLFVVSSYMFYLQNMFEYEDTTVFILNNKYGSPPLTVSLDIISDMINIEDWSSVIKGTIGILNTIDANDRLALQKVNDNNFSKFLYYDEVDEEVYDAMATHIEHNAKGRYKNIRWEKITNWVVFKDDNGKIMKPIGYLPVNLEDCV